MDNRCGVFENGCAVGAPSAGYCNPSATGGVYAYLAQLSSVVVALPSALYTHKDTVGRGFHPYVCVLRCKHCCTGKRNTAGSQG